jgi:hypothetical protein
MLVAVDCPYKNWVAVLKSLESTGIVSVFNRSHVILTTDPQLLDACYFDHLLFKAHC